MQIASFALAFTCKYNFEQQPVHLWIGEKLIFFFAKEQNKIIPKQIQDVALRNLAIFSWKGVSKECVDSWRCVSIHFPILQYFVFSLEFEWTIDFLLI